jgi:hypothetical protein
MGSESADGKHLVYKLRSDRSGSPLLMMPIGGGATTLKKCVYGFSTAPNGIFYYACRPDAFAWTMTQPDPLELRLIDPATGQDRLIGRLTGVGDRFWGPSVSPDGNEFLYGKLANDGQDLLVIENFR